LARPAGPHAPSSVYTMKIAFFVMPGASVIREIDPTVSALLDLGVDLTLVQFWPGDYFPIETLRGGRVRYVTLSDTGIPGFPRLSRRDYERACGTDFDPIAINVHEMVRERYPITRAYIDIDSWHYQQYYSAAFRIGTLLDTLKPNLVIVQGGSDTLQKLVRVKAARLRLPVLGWETPFFPGHLLLDPVGMHFFPGANKIDRDWPETSERPLDAAQAAHLDMFLSDWRQRRASKYAQASDAGELRALDAVVRSGRKIAFFPGQIPADASVLTGPYGVETFDEYLATIRHAMPAGWCLAHKVHPLDPRGTTAAFAATDRYLPLHKTSIHDLFARASVVVTHSSNVGLEALMCGRPVICLAAPHYARKGLTRDVEGAADLAIALERYGPFEPPRERVDRFLHYLIADYLIPAGDTARLQRRLDEAREAWPASSGTTPFETAYPSRARRHRELLREYNQQAVANRSHPQILACLAGEDRFREFLSPQAIAAAPPEFEALRSGARQVCTTLPEVRMDTRLRYALAARLAPPAPRILDVACGVGYGSVLLSRLRRARVDAVDASSEAIAYAREHWAVEAVAYHAVSVADWRAPDDRPYDLVVSFETLEQLSNTDCFLAQLWHALAPGGVLAVSSFNREHFGVRDNPFHVRHFSGPELHTALAALTDACWVRVLGQQVHGPIVESAENCFCVALAVKGGTGAPATIARIEAQLRDLLPLSDDNIVADPANMTRDARVTAGAHAESGARR
jgi:SAM-dependent methyltransferase